VTGIPLNRRRRHEKYSTTRDAERIRLALAIVAD